MTFRPLLLGRRFTKLAVEDLRLLQQLLEHNESMYIAASQRSWIVSLHQPTLRIPKEYDPHKILKLLGIEHATKVDETATYVEYKITGEEIPELEKLAHKLEAETPNLPPKRQPRKKSKRKAEEAKTKVRQRKKAAR